MGKQEIKMNQIEKDKKKQELLLSLVGTEKDNDGLRAKIVKLEREISLFESGFKCKKCGSDEKLQFHHLTSRKDNPYVCDVIKSFKLRHHWEHSIILCREHQLERHGVRYSGKDIGCITKKVIEKTKKRYEEILNAK